MFLVLQEQAKTAATVNLTLNSLMISQMAGGGGRGGGSGPMCTTNLVSRTALSKLTSVQQVYLAKVAEEAAREIMPLPATTWEDLTELSRLLSPPGDPRVNDGDLRKGAMLVSNKLLTMTHSFSFQLFFCRFLDCVVR